MNVLRIAAFSDGEQGGNPAGVSISEALPPVDVMQTIAAEVGFSETAFAAPEGEAWRVRHFSPESEVPFCGHATIALGAALALQHGDTEFALRLNEADITVQGQKNGSTISAALQSPATRSSPASRPIWRMCWPFSACRQTNSIRASLRLSFTAAQIISSWR